MGWDLARALTDGQDVVLRLEFKARRPDCWSTVSGSASRDGDSAPMNGSRREPAERGQDRRGNACGSR
jgi:hypothetical protein